MTHGRVEKDRSVSLLVMQPTPFCNIACDYCYLGHRSDHRRMSLDVVTATFRNVCEGGLLGDSLSVVWHAGEPLVASPSFYQDSFRIAREILPADVTVTHSIQTNGMLINERWCALFEEWGVQVGVSIDGPAFIHDRHRKTRDGKPTHERVMQGIDWLQRRGLPFHVIAVVTRDSLAYADDIMRFFAENGISRIGFNIDEAEGPNPETSMRGFEVAFVDFIRSALQRTRDSASRVDIREIAQADAAIRRDLPRVRIDGCEIPRNSQVVPGAILSVDHEGGFSTWSPELIDMRHERYGDFLLGNVLRDSIANKLSSEKCLSIQRDIMSGVRECERTCGFFDLCGGGAPINKLSENGTFASAETVYCRCSIQAPLRVVLEELETQLGLSTAPAERGLERQRLSEGAFP